MRSSPFFWSLVLLFLADLCLLLHKSLQVTPVTLVSFRFPACLLYINIHAWCHVCLFSSPLPVLPPVSSSLLVGRSIYPKGYFFLIHGPTSVEVIRVFTLVKGTIYVGILWTWMLHLFILRRSPGVWWFHCLNTPSVIWCPRPTDKSQSRQFMDMRNCQLCTARAFSWTDQR